MDTRIRTARPADLDRIVAIDRIAFGSYAFPRSAFRQYLELSGDLFPVSEDPNGVIGYVVGVRSVAPDIAWLLTAAVEPSCRNRGVSRALTRHTLEQCRLLGVSRVRCTVAPGNAPAAHVLQELGFVDIGYDEAYFGRGRPRRILELR